MVVNLELLEPMVLVTITSRPNRRFNRGSVLNSGETSEARQKGRGLEVACRLGSSIVKTLKLSQHFPAAGGCVPGTRSILDGTLAHVFGELSFCFPRAVRVGEAAQRSTLQRGKLWQQCRDHLN
jgi:hypothetical protein